MNNTSQPLVSIVTPVYNEEQYLAECIESVLAQTYQNWEYTIVDNCSTDRSLEIARRYAAKDARIRVHENTRFLRMLPNHNCALRQISAASKYCKVVLGDDWIFPECLEKMVALAEAHPSAGLVNAYQLYGEEVRLTGLPYHTTLVSGRDACRQFFIHRHGLFGTQTSVLYRADLVRSRDPFYLETEVCCPDWEACLAVLRTSDLGFVHQVLTFSRPQASSFGPVVWDLGASFGSMLRFLFAYGRDCLSREEFEECLDFQLCEYYRFLGRRLWVERDHAFWSYHRTNLELLGIGLNRARVARAALRELCRAALEPKGTAARIAKLSSLRQIRSRQKRRVVLQSEHVRADK